MSRYIDVKEFYKRLAEWSMIHGAVTRDEMELILETMPHIDIVRCKECKHWTKWSDWETFCGRLDGGIGLDANDYCSYGERKGE